jgi:hypothetical protein
MQSEMAQRDDSNMDLCMLCSLQTQLCLQYRAEQIAVAVLYLSMRLLRSEAPLSDGRHWWQHCNVSVHELEGRPRLSG